MGGFSIGYGISVSPRLAAFDPDALAYFTTAGITDNTAKIQINDFVVGIKDLGLWNSMVSWPLRSSQNAGTGTTAYSLGGLGTYNGTLVNSPTWQADGIRLTSASSQRISLPNNSFGTGTNPCSIFAIIKNETVGARMAVLSQGNNNSATDSFVLQTPANANGSDAASMAFTDSYFSGTITAQTWRSLLIGNTSFGFRGINGGAVTQFTLNNAINKTGNTCGIGCFIDLGILFFNGVVASVIRIDSTPTTSLNSSIYSLYKTSIGSGLGLP